MRNKDVDLTAALLTLAGAMFMVPVIVLTPTKLILGDIPAMMLKVGLWGMAFSAAPARPSVFIAWAEGKIHR